MHVQNLCIGFSAYMSVLIHLYFLFCKIYSHFVVHERHDVFGDGTVWSMFEARFLMNGHHVALVLACGFFFSLIEQQLWCRIEFKCVHGMIAAVRNCGLS